MSRLVVVGSGAAPYRRYAMETLAARHDLALVVTSEPTWQRAYVDDVAVVTPGDDDALVAAVARLATGPDVGVLTWDELVVEPTARAVGALGLPGMSLDATAACRDKLTTRRLLAAAGLGSARFRHVHDVAQARAAAGALGYPVVVKPRSLAGSAGVVQVADEDELVTVVGDVLAARYSTLAVRPGVLVEELLTGPEVSIDVAVAHGRGHVLQVTRKEVGFAPHFEEVAHVVGDCTGEDWYAPATRLAVTAAAVLGVGAGVTHTEVKLTPRGPAVVEVNARLGGDLIPLVGRLAGGPDQVLAAADVALGRTPAAVRPPTRTARVDFVYPPRDAVVRALDVRAAERVPGVAAVVPLAVPGDELRLPPRAVLGRVAAVLTTGRTADDCRRASAVAQDVLDVTLEPAGLPVGAGT